MGYTEVLYCTELIGLLLIYVGYRYNVAGKPLASLHHAPRDLLATPTSVS